MSVHAGKYIYLYYSHQTDLELFGLPADSWESDFPFLQLGCSGLRIFVSLHGEKFLWLTLVTYRFGQLIR